LSAVTAWSYSRWATYDLCPFKFKCQVIDKLPDNRGPQKALVHGDKVHKHVAAYLLDKGPPTLEAKRFAWLLDQIKVYDDKVVEAQMGFTNEWKPTSWFGKATWARVIWDVGLMYEDDTGEVIDWKTGKKYGSNADQMELFGLSFLRQYPHTKHVTTRLVYLDSGEQEFAEYPRSEADKLQQKWADKVAPLFKEEVWAPRPNDKCRFCPYSKSEGGPCKFG
jgi:hypothetical protein